MYTSYSIDDVIANIEDNNDYRHLAFYRRLTRLHYPPHVDMLSIANAIKDANISISLPNNTAVKDFSTIIQPYYCMHIRDGTGLKITGGSGIKNNNVTFMEQGSDDNIYADNMVYYTERLLDSCVDAVMHYTNVTIITRSVESAPNTLHNINKISCTTHPDNLNGVEFYEVDLTNRISVICIPENMTYSGFIADRNTLMHTCTPINNGVCSYLLCKWYTGLDTVLLNNTTLPLDLDTTIYDINNATWANSIIYPNKITDACVTEIRRKLSKWPTR
jgi:hypothetical protein